MPSFEALIELSGPLVAAIAVVAAGAIAFVAHERASRMQRLLDADPQLAERERVAEELETKRRQLSELEISASQAKNLQKQEAAIRERIAELQGQQSEMEALSSAVQKKRMEMENVRTELESLSNEMRLQEQALSERSREERQVAMRLDDLRSGVGRLEEQRKNLNLQIDSLNQARADADTQHADLQEQLAEVRAEAAAARSDKMGLDAEIDELRNQREALNAEVREGDTIRGQLASTREDAERLRAVRDDLAQDVSDAEQELRAMERSRIGVEAEIADRQRVLAKLLKQVGDAEEKNKSPQRGGSDGSGVSIGDYRVRVASLWEQELPCETTSATPLAEQDALTRVNSHLSRSGLVFHERVVYQFHTALKVANEAPLLVLAGISGTGKSLLPQKYAEAIGINSLLIPVQPRWDGPQDLMGFFNHLEQKYVATPLSRALIQMHQYPEEHDQLRPEGGEAHSLADQMLLVLLDEMNLARVEFYFSEFLSRLETRRVTALNSPRARRRASVPIDCGRPPAGVESLSLFPGPNVLFVGTMNEDETTQSLSDKVVDRANILKFGMPTEMAAGGEMVDEGSVDRLKHDTWKEWLNSGSLHSGDQHRVEEFCEGVNASLEPLGRAFGHRLLKAVSAYVRQYPIHVPNRVDRALADQIEMRILPRLRGVSLDEGTPAIELVSEVAKQCNDAQLSEAIIRAQGSDMAQRDDRFHWAGLSRGSEGP